MKSSAAVSASGATVLEPSIGDRAREILPPPSAAGVVVIVVTAARRGNDHSASASAKQTPDQRANVAA